ncbi:MAG: hypothetical protein KF687_18050 [Cyclobacteriaceae bacterium]|nr:hypothetical protein [Cyclobacteriaceae bacterium]
MKNFITLMFMLIALLAFGQKKKDKNQPPQDYQATIDTLTKTNESLLLANKELTAKLDSLSKEAGKYYALYAVIRDKVVMKEFDPARMSSIIDSLKAGRDSLTLKAASAVITEESVPKTATPLELNPVTQVTFIDSEFVEFTFRNGQKEKCYYVTEGFSPTKSYYIDFKGTKLDIRMYVMYTLMGPRVSFEVPSVQGLYYYGQMTQ